MDPLHGHEAAERTLLAVYRSGRMHHGWLLAGPEGLGKASFAWRAAAHILSREPGHDSATLDPDPASQAADMVARKVHPDCIELTLEPRDDKERRKREEGKVFDMRRNIAVDQVRAMQRRLTTRPSMGARRCIIIDSVDDMEKGAANALLKSLEEPPESTIFLMVSHNPGRLLPTIRSRCQTLRFEPLDDAAMARCLDAIDPGWSAADRAAVTAFAMGAPGRAKTFAELQLAEVSRTASEIVQTGDPSRRLRASLAQSLEGKANRERFLAFLKFAPQFAMQHCRTLRGPDVPIAIDASQAIARLAAEAVPLNYEAKGLIFRIGDLLATLGRPTRSR